MAPSVAAKEGTNCRVVGGARVCCPRPIRPSQRRGSLRAYCAAKEVTLLDYGAGNVRSVRNAIKALGYTIKEVRHAMEAAAAAGAMRHAYESQRSAIEEIMLKIFACLAVFPVSRLKRRRIS